MSFASARFDRRDWLWLCLVFGAATATLLVRTFVSNADGPLFADTDDAMRMVVVRDFLAGQNWYDHVQHRLNTPWGAEIHWSRFVDLPIAALLFFGRLFLPEGLALGFAGIVWPLMLLFLLLWLSARTTLHLIGRAGLLPALVLPILSPAVLAEFMPGRVDHHNVIVVLTMAVLLTAMLALSRPLMAYLCGLLVATALAIAIEALPVAVAAILAFGFAYVVDPARAANLRRFGIAFALGMLVHLALAQPRARWLEAACDMISPVYALAALTVGAAYALVSFLPAPGRAFVRFLLLAFAGIAACVPLIVLYPQCLSGPYGELDPWLQSNWIAAIVEARPWHQSLISIPAYAISVAAPVLLAIVIGLFALSRSTERRMDWLVVLVFNLLTALVMLAQVRGARLALLPAIPAAAWLIVSARNLYLVRPRLVPALVLIGSWLLFSGYILSILVTAALALRPETRVPASTGTLVSTSQCRMPDSLAPLRSLPPQRIMSPIDLGSHILLETDHAVVAAPYHRNEAGVLDAFRFLGRPAEEAYAIAQNRGLTLFVTCDGMPETRGESARAEGTILSLIDAGNPPSWLEPVSVDGPVEIYRISLSAQP